MKFCYYNWCIGLILGVLKLIKKCNGVKIMLDFCCNNDEYG